MPVVDASVTLAWAFEEVDASASETLERLRREGAVVPSLWWFEVRNGLVMSERRGLSTVQRTARFLRDISHSRDSGGWSSRRGDHHSPGPAPQVDGLRCRLPRIGTAGSRRFGNAGSSARPRGAGPRDGRARPRCSVGSNASTRGTIQGSSFGAAGLTGCRSTSGPIGGLRLQHVGAICAKIMDVSSLSNGKVRWRRMSNPRFGPSRASATLRDASLMVRGVLYRGRGAASP